MSKPQSPFSGLIQKRKEFIRLCHEEAEKRRMIVDKFKRVFGKYGIRKAFLFGSVIEQSCMPHSDIDIYAEDLEGKRYWDLWRDLEELANQPVDLYCQLDDPVFVKKIKERGELIYEG